MPKRKRDVAAPVGRPKRARQPRKESEFVYESATPMPVVPIEGEQAAEQHSAIAGPGHSMQVLTLTEDQMDRIAAKVAAQLNRPRTAAANETVTSGSFQHLYAHQLWTQQITPFLACLSIIMCPRRRVRKYGPMNTWTSAICFQGRLTDCLHWRWTILTTHQRSPPKDGRISSS